MSLISQIQEQVLEGIREEYKLELSPNQVVINPTRKDVEGDLTLVVFPFVKMLKKSPQMIGEFIGEMLMNKLDLIDKYDLLGGFLNIHLKDGFWNERLRDIYQNEHFGVHPKTGKKILVEFSSPNTNKPLHLGHIRNILLGWSASKIAEAAGHEVIKTQIINDRGIAVCKSMLAWQKFSDGETPQSSGIKSDHFVGKYYVIFDQKLREEYGNWQDSAKAKEVYQSFKKEGEDIDKFFKRYKNNYFNEYSALGAEATTMLEAWEENDTEVRALWQKMNQWVYDGFESTYVNLGVNFDCLYYESDTYTLGKDIIEEGLSKSIFYKKEDGSVWIDLEDKKLDHKLVLRSNGTSVYMTQDIGTANKRFKDHGVDAMVYVVGDEQDYHFKVLFEILKAMDEPYTEGLYHLSYGMIDLPTGKMKSREGTVVDADDLMAEVIEEARLGAADRGILEELSVEEQNEVFSQIGMGALKYFILKVGPKKRMVFDPKDSVDMQGQTGPYIQNAVVRINSILRKLENWNFDLFQEYSEPLEAEKNLIKHIHQYPDLVLAADAERDPSILASFAYELAKDFHKFYHDVRIIKAESEMAKAYRVVLCTAVKDVLTKAMDLLGIEMPKRM